jgi:hypothetical protein
MAALEIVQFEDLCMTCDEGNKVATGGRAPVLAQGGLTLKSLLRMAVVAGLVACNLSRQDVSAMLSGQACWLSAVCWRRDTERRLAI